MAVQHGNFSKCVETALNPLREEGVTILTYIDDWLILDSPNSPGDSTGYSAGHHHHLQEEHSSTKPADALSLAASGLVCDAHVCQKST